MSPRKSQLWGGGGYNFKTGWPVNIFDFGAYTSMPHPLFGAKDACDIEKKVAFMCSLSDGPLFRAEPSSLPHSMAVTELLGKGAKRKSLSGRGQACSNSIIPARRRLAKFAVYFGHFRINDHFAIGPKG